MFGNNLEQLIVLDSIKEKLEMINSDIIPGSETHITAEGTENTPTSIQSVTGSAYSGDFTTFPLKPLAGNVHYIKDSFLEFDIDVNFSMYIATNISSPLYFYIGPRDTASIFKQLQILFQNNAFWTSPYQRVESAICLAGLPASVVDHSNNYATIDKLLHFKDTPMKLVTIPAGTYRDWSYDNDAEKRKQCNINVTLNYVFTIDLNRLCVPLSNIDYITENMGELQLKCYLGDFHESFFVMQVPNGFSGIGVQSVNNLNYSFVQNGLISLEPVRWGSCGVNMTGVDNSHETTISMSNPTFFLQPAMFNVAVADGTLKNPNGSNTDVKLVGGLIDFSKLTALDTYCPVQFILHDSAVSTPFMKVQVGRICQTCFSINNESYAALHQYFQDSGAIILPIQTWFTNIFNNGTIDASNAIPTTLNTEVTAQNVTDVAVAITPTTSPVCLLNPFMNNITLRVNGTPLNNPQYLKVDNRAIQDFTDACVDTDYDEINTDYMYSLQFPPLINAKDVVRTSTEYQYTIDKLTELEYFSRMRSMLGNQIDYIKNPNLFMMIFQTALPCSFHTGLCVGTNAPRKIQTILTNSSPSKTELAARYPSITNLVITNKQTGGGSQEYHSDNNTIKHDTNTYHYSFPVATCNTTCQIFVSMLTDVCIVINYDQFPTGAILNYAAPMISSV